MEDCQRILICLSFRSFTIASTSLVNCSCVGMRLSRHCFTRAENSISIMFSQLAAFGVLAYRQAGNRIQNVAKEQRLLLRGTAHKTNWRYACLSYPAPPGFSLPWDKRLPTLLGKVHTCLPAGRLFFGTLLIHCCQAFTC